MYQLIIKNGKVIGTHKSYQDVSQLYKDCECISWPEEIGPKMVDGVLIPPDDPRTDEEKLNNYCDKRRVEYPSIQEQLDMIYHDRINETNKWAETITAIKEKYPKDISCMEH